MKSGGARDGADRKTTPLGALAALGIVYGDLGTSPLYTLQTVIAANGGHVAAADALGILSLIVWALILIISVKYCLVVLRADNNGEGGILALMALIGAGHTGRRTILVTMGLFGAALIYGDGIITPAISVLSAVEGVNAATSALKPFVMPLSVVILLGLFSVQRFGTARIGHFFGPIMLAWFIVIAALGVLGVVHHPGVLVAIDPLHAAAFLARHGWGSFVVLGGVFLAVTGGEALYADLGHIGRGPIRAAWYGIVLPALLLSYAGQTALLLEHPGAAGNPFFRTVPSWGLYPMVVLATCATVIASQAIITGAFSLTRQGMQLGWLPGLTVRQTSPDEYGQIYLPFVNWMMMLLTIALTVGFGSSDRLAGAYGTAVSTTMWLTTALLYHAMRERWGWSLAAAGSVAGLFLIVDLTFFSANLMKIGDGGWIPLLLGAVVYVIMTTWRRGHRRDPHAGRRDRRIAGGIHATPGDVEGASGPRHGGVPDAHRPPGLSPDRAPGHALRRAAQDRRQHVGAVRRASPHPAGGADRDAAHHRRLLVCRRALWLHRISIFACSARTGEGTGVRSRSDRGGVVRRARRCGAGTGPSSAVAMAADHLRIHVSQCGPYGGSVCAAAGKIPRIGAAAGTLSVIARIGIGRGRGSRLQDREPERFRHRCLKTDGLEPLWRASSCCFPACPAAPPMACERIGYNWDRLA